MSEERNPCLERRNAHPLVQTLTARRREAVAEMLCELAAQIRSGAHDDEFFEETRGYWSDSFFKVARRGGVIVDAMINFTPALDHCSPSMIPGLRVAFTTGAEAFAGCAPLPVEVELRHDIPSEEP